MWAGSAAASSAKAPPNMNAATRSPAAKPLPAGAWRTTPATSSPGMNGNGGFSWYSPRVISMSAKLTPAACTSISAERPSSPSAVGAGTSWRTTPSGPVNSDRTSARMTIR